MNKEIKELIEENLKAMDKSIVATPETREKLDAFAVANNGANDHLLVQMAINFGYKLAHINLLYHIENTELETKNK